MFFSQICSLLHKTMCPMRQVKIDVIFDRRKLYEKNGVGFLEVRIYFARRDVRYVTAGTSTPENWEKDAKSEKTLEVISQCQKIVSAMEVLGEPLTKESFNNHFLEKEKEEIVPKVEDNSSKDFIAYCEEVLASEQLAPGTRRHKQVVIDALKTYGKIQTYGDLTAKNLMAFDKWLHNGERTDVTIYGYHKKLKKWVGELERTEQITRNPYKMVTFNRGKTKERQPLLESELKNMRDYPFDGKLERVRDLFIFSAYTGLAFCDVQNFDYQSMTVKEGNLVYIDGNRIKTDTKFFTPILSPAMEVLKKYDYKLPKISNQKANDYLHLIQAKLDIKKNLTFHVARHSFATLALAHDVPIENVARMLGHEDIRTTQIYAKILRTTIERHACNLQSAIL